MFELFIALAAAFVALGLLGGRFRRVGIALGALLVLGSGGMLLTGLWLFAPETLGLPPDPRHTPGEASGGWVLMVFVVYPAIALTLCYLLGLIAGLLIWRRRGGAGKADSGQA